jgi:hypothetical protein
MVMACATSNAFSGNAQRHSPRAQLPIVTVELKNKARLAREHLVLSLSNVAERISCKAAD